MRDYSGESDRQLILYIAVLFFNLAALIIAPNMLSLMGSGLAALLCYKRQKQVLKWGNNTDPMRIILRKIRRSLRYKRMIAKKYNIA